MIHSQKFNSICTDNDNEDLVEDNHQFKNYDNK